MLKCQCNINSAKFQEKMHTNVCLIMFKSQNKLYQWIHELKGTNYHDIDDYIYSSFFLKACQKRNQNNILNEIVVIFLLQI